jgi:long-chain acyl-CoA synthetase
MDYQNSMPALNSIYQNMLKRSENECLFWNHNMFTYNQFCIQVQEWRVELRRLNVVEGFVCGLFGEFSFKTCTLFMAMMLEGVVIVPFTISVINEIPQLQLIAGCQGIFKFNEEDHFTYSSINDFTTNELIKKFISRKHAGLVVFSSGSTGKPKGILQDCEFVIQKFLISRKGWRTIMFLMFDHFGGINTFLSALAYGGVVICLPKRNPEVVCQIIEETKANLLPTTPTFLNLLFASQSYKLSNLSSIDLITYGTEVMNETTLKKVKQVFPNAQLKQTYGLSELGVLRSKSESNDSVWVKIGGDGFNVKIINNILWVKSSSNMVGYLNAPQPFDEDGWMSTGDEVEVKGDYIRIIGRKSEMVNIGGQKVFPAEVEEVLMEDANLKEVTVFGVNHSLMGKVLHARVSLLEDENIDALTARLKRLCLNKLSKFKIPIKFIVIDSKDQRTDRFKKIRNINQQQADNSI